MSASLRIPAPNPGPRPSPDLVVVAKEPFNAEPNPAALGSAFLTPQPDFFVRINGEVPAIDPETHRIRLFGRELGERSLSLAEIQAFPHHEIDATLQCAGNRRTDMQRAGKTSGNMWAAGAIGNARWTGIRLADLLRSAGIGDPAGLHVAFGGRDVVHDEGEVFRYNTSVPAGKALAPETLLAFLMNGEPLAPEHGFPLRAIVPGYAGVRSVKWIDTIELRDRPSECRIHARDYRLFPPGVTQANVVWEEGVPIYELPVTSAILSPGRDAALPAGRTRLSGYATAAPKGVASVEVSGDGGATWTGARLTGGDGSRWTWTLWEAELDLPPGSHELVVRATDRDGGTQPEHPAEIWNFRGYVSTAWHRVRVEVG